MQLMSWMMGRLGSRFSLLFEPYQRRVMHSALGRFLDQPLDLMVGLVEPGGRERALPFTTRGTVLYCPEQFERLNSITFRGYCEGYRLSFELNIHAVFYPQDEALCIMPVYYLEMRVNPVERVRWIPAAGPTPEKVTLFIRLARPGTAITASAPAGAGGARIDLAYKQDLRPRVGATPPADPPGRMVEVRERIVSLNPEARPESDGHGLICELPVTEVGSGIKWRLIWGAHCGDAVLEAGEGPAARPGRFRYTALWPDIDAVVDDAISKRDERLAHSRRLEKLFEQAPMLPAQRHLLNQGFQNFLSNTYWCNFEGPEPREWFSGWEGSCTFHSTVDVEYNVCLFYLTMWPRLLALLLGEWAAYAKAHEPSGGAILGHDMGQADKIGRTFYHHDMPVEENSNYLLMLGAYCHWTGDLGPARKEADLIEKLARYLLWTDRDGSGFPSEGVANTIDDGSPAVQFSRKQTYLAVKRLAALQAAGDLLARIDRSPMAEQCEGAAGAAALAVERQAWLGDHYAVCVDRSTAGVLDSWTGAPLAQEQIAGADAYSLYTNNGLLLPALTGQPCPLNQSKLLTDLINAAREALGHYGCGHSSYEPNNLWVSQNLWRDHMARYLGFHGFSVAQMYWDMQVMSNTHQESLGFIDTYIGNNLSFYPRGAAAFGFLAAGPRLVIDRLAPKAPRFSVDPDRTYPQRWPLVALADWKAGKIPVCVVDAKGRVAIEGEIDPIIIRGQEGAGGADIG